MDNDESKKIEDRAFRWVKDHTTQLIDLFAKDKSIPQDDFPTTVFMAGSPGVGKTEFSRRLSETFIQKPVIIDADEIRTKIPGYVGQKAYLYQRAATKGVHILYDYSCKKKLNIIMDGTFAYGNVFDNVEHSLKYGRNIEIYFLYQDPKQSWEFTKVREKQQTRNVPKEVFIKAFFKSIENANSVKAKYGSKVKLNVAINDFKKGLQSLELNKETIDNYLPKVYTIEDLEEELV